MSRIKIMSKISNNTENKGQFRPLAESDKLKGNLGNDQENGAIDQNNPFVLMKKMLFSSLGKIPTGLVLILVAAMLLSILSGLVLKYAANPDKRYKDIGVTLSANPDINPDVKLLQGVWVTSNDQYAMSLSITRDKYEWIVKSISYGSTRFFSRGIIKTQGDIIVLEQRNDMGYPLDRDRLWVTYLPMSVKNMNARFDVSKKKMVWIVPQSQLKNLQQPILRIFSNLEEKPLVWSK